MADSGTEHQFLIDRAKHLAEEFAPRAAKWDQSRSYCWENVEALQKAGLMGMTLPTQYGGFGASYLTVVKVIEEIAKARGQYMFVDDGPDIDQPIRTDQRRRNGERGQYARIAKRIAQAAQLAEGEEQDQQKADRPDDPVRYGFKRADMVEQFEIERDQSP